MNKENATLRDNPRDTAGFLSKLTFFWVIPLLIEGYKKPLEKKDMFVVQKEDESMELGDKLQKNWEDELMNAKMKNRKPSYIRALMKTFGLTYGLVGILCFIEECVLRVGQPIFLGNLIRYYYNVELYSIYEGVLFSSGVSLISLLYLFAHHPLFWFTMHIGMQARIASCSTIYRKAIRLSQKAIGQTTVGQMINLLSNDVNRFDTSVVFLHYLWVGPLQTTIVTFILWSELGPSCLAGIAVLVLSVPLQSWMGKVFSRLRATTAHRTDERIRVMNEVVNAMRVIKMYAWEIPFKALINEARRREISIILKTSYFRAINMALFFTSSKLIVFLALLTYVLTGNVLTAEKVFVTTSLINNVRLTMTLFFPFAISMGSETIVSCRRIQAFLTMEEREDNSRVHKTELRPKIHDCKLEIQSISASWVDDYGDNDLEDISVTTKAGELTAVVGEVGSGKSSLLQAILCELPILKGSINIRGKISYAPQVPWLFSGTVRSNILLGQPFNHKRYNEVIKVCCLERDLEILPEGDNTLVGERGVSLSGGQKARISLARAVYYDADIYLLDDPLSAVDADVGRQLYDRCIVNFLRSKVRILATHQLQLTKTASQILILQEGRVKGLGTYSELIAKGIDFETLQSTEETEQPAVVDNYLPILNELSIPAGTRNRIRHDSLLSASGSFRMRRGSLRSSRKFSVFDIGSQTNLNIIEAESSGLYDSLKTPIDASRISMNSTLECEDEVPSVNSRKAEEGEEVQGKGSIGWKVYWKYLRAGSSVLLLMCLFVIFIAAQLCFTGADYWLSYWSNKEQEFSAYNLPEGNYTIINIVSTERKYFISIYTGITASLFLLSLIRTALFFTICMVASKTLHNRMLSAMVEVPIKFFDTHPIGSILNRFTKDLGQIDDLLPPTFFDFAEITFSFIGIISVVAIVNVWIILPTLILGIAFVLIRNVFLRSARDIKRLEGITRSPVFSHLSSTLTGLTTIRSMNAQEAFIKDFDSHQDLHSSTWFLFLCTTRCFGFFLDGLTCIYISTVTFSFLFMNGPIPAGDVGLAISSAMALSGMFQWGVRQSAEVENQMTSVERVLEYSKLESEHTVESPESKDDNWPSRGKLTFKDVTLVYDPQDPPVLKNLNFKIDPGMKVGIVGRTGAGKSSLLTCLFRLTQPQGTILIDDVDTSTLHLSDLRSSISIIPQDPTLFNGTIRQNMDPFSIYADEDIWNAIEEVQLKKTVAEMSGGLDGFISEGGSNLSVGQRQLVCLARAILKHNKILVMDEATANVDPYTDQHIQQTIRTKFVDCTVLTIAHRLNTIMDSNKIMVMDAGELKEFQEPHLLLKDQSSIFSQLVDQTGPSSSKQLREQARKTYLSKESQCPTIERNNASSNCISTHEEKTKL